MIEQKLTSYQDKKSDQPAKAVHNDYGKISKSAISRRLTAFARHKETLPHQNAIIQSRMKSLPKALTTFPEIYKKMSFYTVEY